MKNIIDVNKLYEEMTNKGEEFTFNKIMSDLHKKENQADTVHYFGEFNVGEKKILLTIDVFDDKCDKYKVIRNIELDNNYDFVDYFIERFCDILYEDKEIKEAHIDLSNVPNRYEIITKKRDKNI